MKKTPMADFSRRDFLKGAALAGAGLAGAGALSACAPKAKGAADQAGGNASVGSANGVTWTKEADVVVVGFGGAGAAAALDAKKAGAEVIMLELNAQGGGSTNACGGFIMMGGTDLQKKFGLEDDVDNFYAYLSAAAGANANQDAIKLVCDSSPDLYRWCVEQGMDFESGTCDPQHHLGGYNAGTSLGYSGNEMARDYAAIARPVPRGHMPQPSSSGKDIFAALKKSVETAGIEVLYGTAGSKLLVDDKGRVAGLLAKKDDEEMYVKARKGVILTCGGFIDNEELYNAYYPYTNKRGPQLTTAGSENGSGILMGMELGAATQGMGCFQIGYPLVTMDENAARCVLVDSKGHRIVAEDEYNSFMGKAIIQAPSSQCYALIDDESLQLAKDNHFGDEIASSGNLAEVAQTINVDSDVLANTIEFYNESAHLGTDREFGKNPQFLKPLTGTYHVFPVGSEKCYTASCGGLKIDLDAHVLDHDDKIIPGLYAAGRNAGTIYGWYMGSGSSMLDVLTFGRIAGKNAAAETVAA